jgi:PAS domain S-box-containing protein
MTSDPEQQALRAVAMQNASAILAARRRAEEALVVANEALEQRTRELDQSLSLMQATLESTTDGIFVSDLARTIVLCNERFLGICGLSRAEVIGAPHEQLVERFKHRYLNSAAIAARIGQVYASPSTEALDVLELADGRVFERFSRPQLVNGVPAGRVWCFRDITDRRLVEAAAREETGLLDLLISTGRSIVSTLDLNAVLQTVTDAATQLTGAQFGAFFYNTVDEAGEALSLYTLSGAPREAFEGFGQPRATPLFGPTFRGEGPVRCDDVQRDPRFGQWAPHHGMPAGHRPVRSYLAVAVVSRTGEPVGGLFFGHATPGIFSQRSERLVVGIAAQAGIAIENARLYERAQRIALEREKLVEAERVAREEIARVSNLKDEFLATLSHELRTPLSAVIGWARVLLQKKHDPQTQTRGLEAIERNAAAQARLIDDLLDMNRIISGKVRLDVRPTTLDLVVEAALESVGPSAQARGIRLRKVIDPQAGPVWGDPGRLQQVLWNLLTNSIKFTKAGGAVDVVLQRINSHLELSVSDTGCGIEAEFLPHVFDRFRQADSSPTRQQGGLGLGLSIVKHLVELHGGSVSASSEGHDKGSTFIVRLPQAALRGAPQSAADPPTTNDEPAHTAVDLSGLKILVVDDERDARELMQQLLGDARAEVTPPARQPRRLTRCSACDRMCWSATSACRAATATSWCATFDACPRPPAARPRRSR